MRKLALLSAFLLAACASQQAVQPSTSHAAVPAEAKAGAPAPTSAEAPPAPPDWDAKVNDAAGAAAILAVAQDFEGHPLPPQVASAPSEKIFSNVLVLHDMTAKRFVGAMHGMSKAIGGRCTACHVEGKFASDERGEKRMARKMLVLSQRLNQDFFHGHVALSCYTCHRGSEHPESEPEGLQAKLEAMWAPTLPPIPPTAKRADEVFKNLKLLGGLPPNAIVPVMKQVSLSLGVKCDACHVPGDWASDQKRPKAAARGMIAMVESANAELFGQMHDEDAVTCWTCHRGSEHPVKLPTATH